MSDILQVLLFIHVFFSYVLYLALIIVDGGVGEFKSTEARVVISALVFLIAPIVVFVRGLLSVVPVARFIGRGFRDAYLHYRPVRPEIPRAEVRR